MDKLKNLKFILLALAILLILVIARNPDRNIFRSDVKTAIDAFQNNNLVLYSADMATTSKAWIIPNQLGFKNAKILVAKEIREKLKYKFQPGTTARLELETFGFTFCTK